jgi:hypothetical protein
MDELSDELVPEPRRCVVCEKLWGVFGLLLAGVFAFIATDVLTNGALSDLIGRKGHDDE